MQIEKPKPKRVYVTASDPDGVERSRSTTVYETTPDRLIKLIEEAVGAAGQKVSNRRRRSSAAA